MSGLQQVGTPASGRLRYLRDLLLELIRREMKLRYKRSTLGLAWSLLNPLAQLLVFAFVFSKVLPLGIPNYTAFLFCGLLAWNWFQGALLAGTGAIVDNRDLVKRPGFPAQVLPVVSVATHFVHYLLALPVLLLFLFFNRIPLTPALLALPLVFAVQFLLTVGLAYLLAALYVPLRDVQYLLGIALMLGFYLSPVLYGLESVPPAYRTLYLLNPLAWLIGAYRTIFLDGAWPLLLPLLALLAASALLTLGGYHLFQRMSFHFAEEL